MKFIKKHWLVIVLVLSIITVFAIIIYKNVTRIEAELTFPDTVVVENATTVMVDKYVKALTYNVLEYDTMNILITYMPAHMQERGDFDLKAYVQKNIFADNAYVIYISKKINVGEIKRVLSHEFVHIEQMQNGILEQVGIRTDVIIYDGDTIVIKEVPYDKRPYEIEAQREAYVILKQLDNILYE